jgi:hypothetical protein
MRDVGQEIAFAPHDAQVEEGLRIPTLTATLFPASLI